MYKESRLNPPVDGEAFPVTMAELKADGVELQGDKVTLVPLRVKDSASYLGLIAFDRDHMSQFGDTTAQKYQKPSDVGRSIARAENPFRLRFGIWDGDIMVGSINLEPGEENSAIVGYWIGKEYVRNGYASDALSILATFAFEQLGYQELEAEAVYENTASRATLEKAGFTANGTLYGRPYKTETGKEVNRIYVAYTMQSSSAG